MLLVLLMILVSEPSDPSLEFHASYIDSGSDRLIEHSYERTLIGSMLLANRPCSDENLIFCLLGPVPLIIPKNPQSIVYFRGLRIELVFQNDVCDSLFYRLILVDDETISNIYFNHDGYLVGFSMGVSSHPSVSENPQYNEDYQGYLHSGVPFNIKSLYCDG